VAMARTALEPAMCSEPEAVAREHTEKHTKQRRDITTRDALIPTALQLYATLPPANAHFGFRVAPGAYEDGTIVGSRQCWTPSVRCADSFTHFTPIYLITLSLRI